MKELDRLDIENDPYPEKCLKESSGFAGETIVYCADCGNMNRPSEMFFEVRVNSCSLCSQQGAGVDSYFLTGKGGGND